MLFGTTEIRWFLGFLNGDEGPLCRLSSSSLLCLCGLEPMFMLLVLDVTCEEVDGRKWSPLAISKHGMQVLMIELYDSRQPAIHVA